MKTKLKKSVKEIVTALNEAGKQQLIKKHIEAKYRFNKNKQDKYAYFSMHLTGIDLVEKFGMTYEEVNDISISTRVIESLQSDCMDVCGMITNLIDKFYESDLSCTVFKQSS